MKLLNNRFRDIVELALKEDIGKGDLTSSCLMSKDHRVRAIIIAKEEGILCGIEVAKFIFRLVDTRINIKDSLKDGSFLKPGKTIMRLEGPGRGILSAERTVLNFLARLSGIASLTNQFVKKIKPYNVKIMDTRKTTPGLRYLEKYAVKIGGGVNHRMGLDDGILIKDNYLRVMSYELRVMSLKELIERIKNKVHKNINIEIEVTNIKEFKEAIEAKPDIIMLDNMRINDIRKAVSILRTTHYRGYPESAIRNICLEVSGGVRLSNVREIAGAGVDRISVGALTHSARSLDMSLDIV